MGRRPGGPIAAWTYGKIGAADYSLCFDGGQRIGAHEFPQICVDPPSHTEAVRWRIRHADAKHFSGVHTAHANLSAVWKPGKISEVGIILNVLAECLPPVADQEHARPEKEQAADNKESQTYISILHLLITPDQFSRSLILAVFDFGNRALGNHLSAIENQN